MLTDLEDILVDRPEAYTTLEQHCVDKQYRDLLVLFVTLGNSERGPSRCPFKGISINILLEFPMSCVSQQGDKVIEYQELKNKQTRSMCRKVSGVYRNVGDFQ